MITNAPSHVRGNGGYVVGITNAYGPDNKIFRLIQEAPCFHLLHKHCVD